VTTQAVKRFTTGLCSAAVFLAALGTTGCSMPRRYEPKIDPGELDGTTFLHYLGTVPVASFDEGCRAVLLLADGQESYATHQERYAELVRRGIVRDGWGLQEGDILDKGTLAYMAFRTCRLPHSVNTLLFGSWGLGDRRYAMKAAAAAGLMRYDVPEHAVRGGELLAVLGRMDAYMAEQGQYEWDRADVDTPEAVIGTPDSTG
jgi:hypothetical protein